MIKKIIDSQSFISLAKSFNQKISTKISLGNNYNESWLTNFDEYQSFWHSFYFPYYMKNEDPFSRDYYNEVLNIYQNLTNESYHNENEIMPYEAPFHKVEYPWIANNVKLLAREYIKYTHIFRTISQFRPNAKSIIEFGCGWGNVIIPLSRIGFSACAVDINKDYLTKIDNEAKRLDLNIDIVNKDFIEAAKTVRNRYDIVIFSASFHHCLEFKELLEIIRDNLLTENGVILFFDEPIIKNLSFPWGIRYDGRSILEVMNSKVIELGFSEMFFRELLIKTGYKLKELPDHTNVVGSGWIAKK